MREPNLLALEVALGEHTVERYFKAQDVMMHWVTKKPNSPELKKLMKDWSHVFNRPSDTKGKSRSSAAPQDPSSSSTAMRALQSSSWVKGKAKEENAQLAWGSVHAWLLQDTGSAVLQQRQKLINIDKVKELREMFASNIEEFWVQNNDGKGRFRWWDRIRCKAPTGASTNRLELEFAISASAEADLASLTKIKKYLETNTGLVNNPQDPAGKRVVSQAISDKITELLMVSS